MKQNTDQNTNQNPFGAPEKGDLPVERTNFPIVEYGTMKTPANLVKHITKGMIDEAIATNKLGFSYWDKDQALRVHLGDKFTFVVLEVYSQISGQKEIAPKTFEKFYSNKVKDSRTEPFAIFRQGDKPKRPIAKGLYQDLRGDEKKGVASQIPKGCSFHLVFVVYWLEGDRVLNLKGSVMVSNQLKEAIAAAERGTGRTKKSSDVSLFGLADTGSLWGFQFKTYRRVTKEGDEYKGSGDCYFVPDFYAGVVKGEGPNANPDLYAICKGYQEDVRLQYEQMIERRKKYGDDSLEGHEDDGSAGSSIEQDDDARFPTDEHAGQTTTTPEPGDDLPF